MIEVEEEAELGGTPAPMIKIPVKTGHGEERVVELELGRSVTAILEIVATERGCRIDELILIREGHAEALTSVILIEADYPHKRRHHVHHAGDVAVTVDHQARQETRGFKRGATVEDVLTWAISVFPIDPGMASEFELARHGQKAELPGAEHIGHMAGVQRDLALDLVRGDIANGNHP